MRRALARDGRSFVRERRGMPLALTRRVTIRVAVATVVAFGAFAAGIMSAQARFEVRDQTTLPGAAGLRVIALRDNSLESCYLVFVAQTPGQLNPLSDVETADIPGAMATRDRRLAELLRAFDQERGAIPGTIIPNPLKYDWLADTAQFEFALTVLANDFARLEQRIERTAAESRMAITAVPAPCGPAPTPSAEHRPETRR